MQMFQASDKKDIHSKGADIYTVFLKRQWGWFLNSFAYMIDALKH